MNKKLNELMVFSIGIELNDFIKDNFYEIENVDIDTLYELSQKIYKLFLDSEYNNNNLSELECYYNFAKHYITTDYIEQLLKIKQYLKTKEKCILATSTASYIMNGYPFVFELYYFSDDDSLYLDIFPEDPQTEDFKKHYEKVADFKRLTFKASSLAQINSFVEEYTNDDDALFIYDHEEEVYRGNCY